MAVLLYNVKFILLLSASFIIIFSGTAIFFCLPLMIGQFVRNQLIIEQNSGSFEGWRLNPVPIIDRFYLYNITNYEEITQSIVSTHRTLTDIDKPTKRIKLKEIGPFSFRQEREKVNITFNTTNNTVVYDQLKRWYFLPDLTLKITTNDSKADSTSTTSMSMPIYHVNLPLAGTTLNTEFAEFINPIVSEHDLKLFLRHNVSQLLFDGYPDELMKVAKDSNSLDIDRFGWMYNQNNISSGTIRIFTGSYTTIEKIGIVQQFNKRDEMDIWSKEGTCNQFNQSSAGDMFPPPSDSIISGRYRYKLPVNYDSSADIKQSSNSTSQGQSLARANLSKTIHIFLPDICRTFELVFNGTRDFDGLVVDRYIANEYTFDYKTSDHLTKQSSKKCFCLTNELSKITTCPPNGMMDLFTCRKGSPLTISFPHFLYSHKDETLKPYLDILEDENEPNLADHGFFMDLESTLNIPVRVQVALQFNIHYRPVISLLNFTQEYTHILPPKNDADPGDFYIPQMWFSSKVQLDDATLSRLKFLQRYVGLVTPITALVLFILAICLLLFTGAFAYNYTYGKKSNRFTEGAKSTSITSLSCPINDFNDKKKYQQLQMETSTNMNSCPKSYRNKKKSKRPTRSIFRPL